ncbi:MAG: DUF427 domain-containing protein [Solirubrobacterales bacterium]|nr:DUF427 domain-containing protein [Solirubrobacterales bacterium]
MSIAETIRRRRGAESRGRNGRVQAHWNGTVIAESDQTFLVEGNHYFPPESVKREYLEPSADHTTCFWKGRASYYDVVVDGERNPGGAWFYPESSPESAHIKNHVAFWRGIRVRPAPRAGGS